MEVWSFILITILVSALIHLIIFNKKKSKLPPGPTAVPLLGNLLWLRHSLMETEAILRGLVAKHGPVVTLHVGTHRAIFIADRGVAHKALVEHGAAFADRPAPSPAASFISSGQCSISSAPYGPLWRLLRRNLTSEILHASRVRLFADGRGWVLGVLVDRLRARTSDDGGVVAKESFQFAMFCLLVLMCFGEKLDEEAIREIEAAQRALLLYGRKLGVFELFPRMAKYVYSNRLKIATGMREKQKELFLPLIKARREHKGRQHDADERFVYSYLDSILDIKRPDEGGRDLTEDEMVSLCSEFLNAGTDTTSTALEWIMAELVRHPDKQARLAEEVEGAAVGDGAVGEDELQKMPYLKAVIMEGLRRHPPGHFVLSHAVTHEVEIEGHVVPKDASVNFMVAEMGLDERVWEEPKEFKPERFIGGDGEGVDITGSREIKMMPFGVGRRICPGLGLAMLHLEYFVANLVREFEWKAVEGDAVDLAEKPEFTVVMKHPLRARLIPRRSG